MKISKDRKIRKLIYVDRSLGYENLKIILI